MTAIDFIDQILRSQFERTSVAENSTIQPGLLKTLEGNPGLSRRDLAKWLDASLGKAGSCLRALVKEGCLRVSSFRSSEENMPAYDYLLMLRGMTERTGATVSFPCRKIAERGAGGRAGRLAEGYRVND